MKNIFFYLFFLFAFVFTNCRKESNKPTHNQLVIVDRNGNTTVSKPIYTKMIGSHDPSFQIYSTEQTNPNDYDFNMDFPHGGAPTTVTFTSTYATNGIIMMVDSKATGSWKATAGTADIETKNGIPAFTRGPKFMKITFSNVQFTKDISYLNPTATPDTIWVSGIINAYR